MKDLFSFYTFNEPFKDNLVYVQQLNAKEDLLFDLGDCSNAPASLLLRVRWIFLSHTHIDHFCGFPHFLRTILKSYGKEIDIFGPKGIINNIDGALHSYTWNLLDHYDLKFYVHEIEEDKKTLALFDSKDCFEKKIVNEENSGEKTLLDHELFFVKYELLDHKTPVIGFRIEGKNQWAVNKDALNKYCEESGKWLGEAKRMLILNQPPDLKISTGKEVMTLNEIKEKFFFIKKYASYAYLTDFGFTPENQKKAVNLANGAKVLFIESNFLKQDTKNALDTYHLTAYQAGQIAGAAGAQKVKLLHFSQRYLKDDKIPGSCFYEEMEQGKKDGMSSCCH